MTTDWNPILRGEFAKPYWAELQTFVADERSRSTVYPPHDRVFAALHLTPYASTRVMILGQDPYINEHRGISEAHGLCFSVRDGIPIPPSLKNIFLEIQNSVYPNDPQSFSSDLTRWAKQGVLLLNASLSAIAGQSNSHANLGWQKLTDNIIETISEKKEDDGFMIIGCFSQRRI